MEIVEECFLFTFERENGPRIPSLPNGLNDIGPHGEHAVSYTIWDAGRTASIKLPNHRVTRRSVFHDDLSNLKSNLNLAIVGFEVWVVSDQG
jgi:hypothetical protein